MARLLSCEITGTHHHTCLPLTHISVQSGFSVQTHEGGRIKRKELVMESSPGWLLLCRVGVREERLAATSNLVLSHKFVR